jgi:hypothetical protein
MNDVGSGSIVQPDMRTRDLYQFRAVRHGYEEYLRPMSNSVVRSRNQIVQEVLLFSRTVAGLFLWGEGGPVDSKNSVGCEGRADGFHPGGGAK